MPPQAIRFYMDSILERFVRLLPANPSKCGDVIGSVKANQLLDANVFFVTMDLRENWPGIELAKPPLASIFVFVASQPVLK
jgi:hypothetical protein